MNHPDGCVVNSSMTQYMAVENWLEKNGNRLEGSCIGDYEEVEGLVKSVLRADHAPWYQDLHRSVPLEDVLRTAVIWIKGSKTERVLRGDDTRWEAVERTAHQVERLYKREGYNPGWKEHDAGMQRFTLLLERLVQCAANKIAVIEGIASWDPVKIDYGSGSGDGGTGAAQVVKEQVAQVMKRKIDEVEPTVPDVVGDVISAPQAQRPRRRSGDNTMQERQEKLEYG